MKHLLIYLILLALIAGCSDKKSNEADKTSSDDAPKKGSVTADGGLVIFDWLPAGEGSVKKRRNVVLRDGYGMMIFYNSQAENPVARYELYTHKTKEIFKTASPAEFKEKLADIEKGETLHHYNTCTAGTDSGFAGWGAEDIRKFCEYRGVVFQEGDDVVITICTCP